MTMTLTIPEELAARLTTMAEQLGTAPERLAVELLTDDVGEGRFFPALEDVIAEIKASPPDPTAFVPAKESLLEYLRSAVAHEPPIDSEAFDREWARIEADINRRDRVDDSAEGR